MERMERDYCFDTLAVRGRQNEAGTGSEVPVWQTAAFVLGSVDRAVALFNLSESGDIYTRISNPTVRAFEERLAALEGGVGTVATASGQAAVFLAVSTLAGAGDEIVSSSRLYGGTFALFSQVLPRFGIQVRLVDKSDPASLAAAIGPKTRAVYAETIANPRLEVTDIAAAAKAAHAAGVPLILDNTFATPYHCRPFEFGADIVVHSTTKWIGGHGNVIGGAIVDSGNFPWDNGRFPELTTSVPAYGMSFVERFGKEAFIRKVRAGMLRDTGASPSPFDAFLLLMGVETLHLRMQRHSDNAREVARRLEKHPAVAWVNYPGLESSVSYALACRQLRNGFGGMVTFGIKGGFEAGRRFIDEVRLLSHVANVGDTKSLVIHPASTTHSQLTSEQREAAGVPDDMIRLSVGIEALEDIWADIERGLRNCA